MQTLTIPAEYTNWVIKPLKKIKENPSSIFITVNYNNSKDDDIKLSEYIKSSEYKNDNWNWFVEVDEFIKELKSCKN